MTPRIVAASGDVKTGTPAMRSGVVGAGYVGGDARSAGDASRGARQAGKNETLVRCMEGTNAVRAIANSRCRCCARRWRCVWYWGASDRERRVGRLVLCRRSSVGAKRGERRRRRRGTVAAAAGDEGGSASRGEERRRGRCRAVGPGPLSKC
jgi:hypothetical protein